MLVIGVDPGPDRCGWAVVAPIQKRGHVALESCGHDKWDRIPHGNGIYKLAIERPRFHGMTRQIHPGPLIDTAYVAGRIAESFYRFGPITEFAAGDWKRKLGLKPNADDRAVRGVVERFVTGLPKRTNVHVRDACAIALAAAWLLQARKTST